MTGENKGGGGEKSRDERLAAASSLDEFKAIRDEGEQSAEPPEDKAGQGDQEDKDANASEAAGADKDGDGQPDKPGSGDRPSDKPGEAEGDEGLNATEFDRRLKRRLERQKRKDARERKALEDRIAELEADKAGGGGGGESTQDKGGTQTQEDPEPQFGDFSGDNAATDYYKAWSEWDDRQAEREEAEAAAGDKDKGGGTEEDKNAAGADADKDKGGGEEPPSTTEKPPEDPVAEARADVLQLLDEQEGDLGDQFADMLEKEDIRLSDTMIGALDAMSDEEVTAVAQKFVEEPRLSRRIHRAPRASQAGMLKELSQEPSGARQERSGQSQTETRTQLRPGTGQRGSRTLHEIAESGDGFQVYKQAWRERDKQDGRPMP